MVMSSQEIERLLAMAVSLQARAMLTLAYGCGLRAGEVVRLKAGDVDRAQKIIRVVQAKGRKDRHVMLPADAHALLRQWWPERSSKHDRGVPAEERWTCTLPKERGTWPVMFIASASTGSGHALG